jgi:hypothetical protein
MRYRIITINKVTGQQEAVLQNAMTEEAAENFCEGWGWIYDDGEHSFWMDYEEEGEAA